MRTGRFVLSLIFVLVTAVSSWSQKPIHTGNEISSDSKGGASIEISPFTEQTDSKAITLSNAFALVLGNNSSLAAFGEDIRAKDAAAMQAGRLPNPELAVEVENFAGRDAREGFDGAETSISLSQLIELGGKRHKRQRIAALEKELADWDYQEMKLNVLTSVTRDFIQLLAAQQKLLLSEELILLSEKALEAVSARVEAGKVPPLERVRSQIELAVARTDHSKLRRELESARHRLAAHWDAEEASFSEAVGDLAQIERLGEKAPFLAQLPNNPTLARWGQELEREQATYALARSLVVPDPTISIGVRDFRENDSTALLAGVELPLPIFDRNQGGIIEARSNLAKIRHEKRVAEIKIRTLFIEAWQALAAAFDEVTALRNEIFPGAQSAFEAAELGYREGKLNYLQLLDAQRTLFEVKAQLLNALVNYHQARTESDRLIGGPLHGPLQPIIE
jgi:cobalt-zinc-cadmium efflux system outer membrane protein